MQKFTRSLTREIEVGGERVAVTLDADGVVLRPVGSRRPPHTVTWAGVLCAATAPAGPATDQVAQAVAALKKGGEKPAATSESSGAAEPVAATPAPQPLAPEAAQPSPAPAHQEHHTPAPAAAAQVP